MLDEGALKKGLTDPKHGGFVGQEFGRYEILATIAKGAVGAVFRARHKELGNLVALKLLLREDPSPEALGRFRREAQVLARLKHPNVVGIVDLGEENGVPFIVMELVDGRNLHQMVRGPGGELPDTALVVEVMTSTARALAYCHEQGVIHRDVKPHNIIVEHGTGRAVLTDFGLVKKDTSKLGVGAEGASQLSVAGAVMGTPSFMAPEQFEPDGAFGSVEARTDVWAFGATLFFMLTGRPPWDTTNIVDLYHGVTTQPAPSPGSLRETVPVALDEICAACLKKPVAERPTMAELVPRLEALGGTFSKASSQRGLRHTFVIVLLLTALLGADLLWLSPRRGDRLQRLLVSAPAAADPLGGETVEAALARAARNETDAMVRLGLALRTKDPAKAAEWFRRAAEKGDLDGLLWLGICADQGIGAAPDARAAQRWFAGAAAQDKPEAMVWLATYLAAGKGGEKDPGRALTLLKEAQEKGDEDVKAVAAQELTALRQAHPELVR